MTTWYQFDTYKMEIKEIEAEKETAQTITLERYGRRRRVYKDYGRATENYYPTRSECFEAVLEYYEQRRARFQDDADRTAGIIIELREKFG